MLDDHDMMSISLSPLSIEIEMLIDRTIENNSFNSHLNQDKFNRLMGVLPDLRAIAVRGEDFLYFKHRAGLAPSKTLLMEMLHAKRRA